LNSIVSTSIRALATALWLVAVGAPAVAQNVPVADFFRLPTYADVRMSPSGQRLLATAPRPDGRLSLVVLDLNELSKSRTVAGYRDVDIRGAAWVNDDRIVFQLHDSDQPASTNRGTGLFAVSVAGGEEPRALIRPQWQDIGESTNIASRALPPNHALEALLRDGSNDVVVAEWVWSNSGELLSRNLKRVDTVSGIARGISQGVPAGTLDWTLDRAGRPRVIEVAKGATEATYWKPTPESEWVKVSEGDRYSRRPGFDALHVDAANRLYASASVSADVTSLVAIDMAADPDKQQELLATPGFDFHGQLVLSGSGAVLGARYLTDARATLWFDPELKKMQEQVDALLPTTVNQLDCGSCDRRERILVAATSDRQPTAYLLFDAHTGKLAPIAASRPWINPKTMAARDMVRINARDGLSLPVHVTRPNGQKGALPMVVLVHGGPWARGGVWEWDAESQFLASRGYVVIEPEFRGSLGFGWKHFHSGWKQWGLAMQDDVADAALWAVKQGYADPKRVCIAGASYGGYATLMGLIRNPEIFRCGVEWAGVTDIELMYSITWSDFSSDYQRYGMPTLIGDREKDAAQLAATSPIKQAAKITQPLLMAYGGIDRRVPIEHGTQFRSAVRKTNSKVEWIDYPDEGHGWRLPANNIDFWTRVERFLDLNLKNPP